MQNGEQLVKSYLPMSEASFLVLFSLKEPLHGYGIMQRVSELTGGRVNLGAGTVYTILYKMECDGLIESVSVVERRKVYRITETGKKTPRSDPPFRPGKYNKSQTYSDT